MIGILNVGSDEHGICTYELRINRDLITTFTHRRDKGLAACLHAAAQSIEHQMWKNAMDIMDRVREAEAKPLY